MSQWSGTRYVGIGLLCLVGGCGRGEMKVAPVGGTVTLDGTPLDQASVLFLPEKGRPSFGVTDDQGRYTLIYSKDERGAEVGPCAVKVTTRMAPAGSDDDNAKLAPEKVPKRYAKEPVKVTVRPESNSIDIKLTSKP